MAEFEYKCEKCDYYFLEVRSILAPAPIQCPRCRGRINRIFSSIPSISFKGSGFHSNDYKK